MSKTTYYCLSYRDKTTYIRHLRYFKSKELRNRFVLKNHVIMEAVKYGSKKM